jgi:hypothetical protein
MFLDVAQLRLRRPIHAKPGGYLRFAALITKLGEICRLTSRPEGESLSAWIAGTGETHSHGVEDYCVDGAAVDEVPPRCRKLDPLYDSISAVFESGDVLASGGRENFDEDAGFNI